MMNIVFRVDSGLGIGVGHVFRCITLAKAFNQYFKSNIYFICRNHQGHVSHYIEKEGFHLFLLDSKTTVDSQEYKSWLGETIEQEIIDCSQILSEIGHIDWLVIDHYAIDDFIEFSLKDKYKHLLVIDDLANRRHIADILIDQTYGISKERYQPWIEDKTQCLLGSDYALLRDEFSKNREKAMAKRKALDKPKRLLIFFSAIDTDGLTLKVLKLIKSNNNSLAIDIIIGSKSKDISMIKEALDETSDNLYVDCNEVAKVMLEADIAIGAGGCVSWERASLGLPTLLIAIADNQQEIAKQLAAKKAVIYLGNKTEFEASQLLEKLNQLINDKNFYKNMVDSSLTVCDGQGINKVIRVIESYE